MYLFSGLFFSVIGISLSNVVKYDQTQTGDYNIHLDLKNVEILAFLDDTGSNGEYDYDYGELTLKPPEASSNSSWTIKPEGTNLTESTTLDSLNTKQNSTTATPIETTTPNNKTHRRCGAGFYRDTNGRCRRLRRPIKLSGILQHAKNQLTG